MFAVFQTGGKQYKVAEDQLLAVERLQGEAGDSVAFESVLMVGEGDKTTVGAPFVAGATVAAEIVEQGRGPKIIVFKKRRRKNSRRRNGHRQDLTLLRVTEILTDGKKPSAKPAAKKANPAAKKAAPEKENAAEAEKPKKAAKSEPKKAEPKAAAKDTGETAEAKSAKPALLKKPKGEADDLKKLGGVGPKIEEKLNDLGIFHFSQIAAFTPENVAWVDEELNFKGRIERDDWVGQAKQLAAETSED